MLNWDLILFLAFILIMALLIIRDRKKVKREGIILIRRTKKGRDFVDKVAKRNPRLWNILSIIGIAVAIPALVLVSAFLINNTYGIVSGTVKEGGVRLLLPGPVSAPVLGPAVFIVPWWIWVIGVMSVMIPHEFSHGIMCRLEKIRILSVGWILFLIIPGAFVEPDEKQLKKARRSTRLKVYAAGSFANIALAFIIILLFTAIFSILFTPAGVYFQTVENSTANLTGMSGSIIEMDNQKIVSPDDISAILLNHKPGDTIEVKTTQSNYMVPYMSLFGSNLSDFFAPKPAIVTDLNNIHNYTVTLAEHPDEKDRAYLGISTSDKPTYLLGVDPQLYLSISMLLIWIFIFNLGIGLVNLLPIKPLDGGLVFEVIAEKFSRRSAVIVKAVSGIMLALLIFNLIGPLFI
ncbi:MAG: site-2 protease family protein [Candidatus Aenigmarchaeota archaeon]|nr:site-2 protease family protein [Candidatus Aenigmarchaeota archaeon]